MTAIAGTQGYDKNAAALAARYEALSFDEVHATILDLLPLPPARVLDIGAGSGRDAAHLAALCYAVTATEPCKQLLAEALQRHHDPNILWTDDALPTLPNLVQNGHRFDLVLLSGVFMHLDAAERRASMPVLSQLLAPGGMLILSLRHGPCPVDRRMFDIDPDEVEELARAADLIPMLRLAEPSKQQQNRQAGVVWTRLAFCAPALSP